MDDKSEASANPPSKSEETSRRGFNPEPVLPLPNFITRAWVENNIGNIQASDVRHISKKCHEWIADWPAVKLDHEEFLDQVYRCLSIPNGIQMLNAAFHPKAARKRSVFTPVIDRAIAFLEHSDKAAEWKKIRTKPSDEVAEFVADVLRHHDEVELLRETVFVDLQRGFLRPDRIAWVHDIPGLEEISQFTKALASAQATNAKEALGNNGDTDTPQYSIDGGAEITSQLNSAEQVAAAWTTEIERIRHVINTTQDVPNTEFAEIITAAAQGLMQAVARHRELTVASNLEIDEAFKRTTEAIQNDPRIADVIDPAVLERLFGAIRACPLFEEHKSLLAYMTELASRATKWSAERDAYDKAHSAYVSAAIIQRTELLAPMQESLARLGEISSAIDLLMQGIDDLVRADGQTPNIVRPPASTPPESLDPGITTAPIAERQVSEPRPAAVEQLRKHTANASIAPTPKISTLPPPSPPEIAIQGWDAVNLLSLKGRYPLASFISQTLADTYPTSVGRFRPEVYRLVALAAAAQEIVDVPPEPFRDCCGPLLSHLSDLGWNNSDDDRAILLYLLAGSLFPSIFIPASTARSVVKQNLVGRFGSAAPLHRIIEHVSDADRLGAALAPEALSQSDHQAHWHGRLQDLQTTARDWKNNEEIYHGFGNFRPAEAAWTAMVDPSRGIIGRSMRAFADVGERATSDIRAAAERLKRTSIEGLLEESGMQRLSQRHIEGRARNNLRHNIEASFAFFERCLRHLQRAPDRSRQAGGTGLDRFTTMLRERTTHARQFLQQHQPKTGAEEAALAAARVAVAHLTLMFDRYEPPKTDMSLERWFGRELLLIPGLRFSGGWEPDPADSQILLEGAIAFSKDCPDNLSAALDHAFQTHRRDGAHVSTGRILAELELLGFSKAELALRQAVRESDIRELRKELSSLQTETRDQINMAIALNLIDDVEKRALETRARGIQVERLPIMDLKTDDIPPADRGRGHVAADFPTAEEILKGIEKQLDVRFEVARERLKKDVDRLSSEGLAKPLAVERVNDLLKSRDIVTANEYLRLLRDAQDLPTDTHQNAILRAFMYNFLPKLEQNFSTNRQKITDAALDVLAQKSPSIPGLFDIAEMSAPQRDDASRMLLAWQDIRTATSGLGDAIQRLFAGGLSFDVKQVDDQREKGGRIYRFHLATARLVVPDGFVVPLFGSEANGNYVVEVIRGHPKTIELFQQMQGEAARQRATFHLFANMLDTQDRTTLADRAHNLSYQGVVLDDALIAFLAFERGNRLAALFRIASAFIRHNPYNEVTPLPPEMFYGRVEQRSQIVSRRGGSLVFGGRRLGKSSLLRDVERKDHSPNEDVFVKCVDIHDIGQTEGYAGRLWHRLASELRTASINIRKDSSQADSVVEDIRAFLAEKTSRRLLLMLDEADNFLAAEEENKYENLVRLRQILEETEGRFKVVMAGLHNVQRTATRPNQSLGHFGTPVCIGPFVGNDRYEGLRLVAEPMATLGFEFETSTLPLRILSQTNYFPALVQLYCRELLNHLFKANREGQEGPPFTITAADLDVAYKSQNLSGEINKRFRLTLDLDDRYKLITLVIANAAIEQSDLGTVARPIKPEEVARQCLKWCPALFENRTPSAFLALLEELVGLGVLSQQGRDGFVLRSPNIVTMLGSADSIADELLNFDSREPPAPDRSAQRRVLDHQRGVPSPLTPAQEHRLLEIDTARVSIVLASMATGLENIDKAIQSVTHQLFDRSLDRGRVQSADELLRKIASRGRESVSENRLVLVPFEVGWTLPWIRRVSSVYGDLAQRHIRIMFIGGPSHARTLAEESALAEEVDIESAELWTETTLRSYLAERERKDCDIPELRAKMLHASGFTGEGMRYLLNAIGNKGDKFDDAAALARKELGRRMGVAANFGIESDLEPFYRALARWSPCSEIDLKAIIDDEFGGTAAMSVEALIRYGIWMGVLFRNQELEFEVNPLLKFIFDPHPI